MARAQKKRGDGAAFLFFEGGVSGERRARLRRRDGREEVGEDLAEFGGEDRLVEDAVDLQALIGVVYAGAQFGAENQHLALVGQFAHAGDELDAVEVRHVVIGDHKIVGIRIRGDPLERLLTVADAFDEMAFAAQGNACDFAEFTHVVGVENTQRFFRQIGVVLKHCRMGVWGPEQTGPQCGFSDFGMHAGFCENPAKKVPEIASGKGLAPRAK